MLHIVSTPIGNLKDITYRAVEVLKDADLIAAEDTRRTRVLANHYDIPTPLTSYHDHNKLQKGPLLLDKMKAGRSVALVSDAGTPGISDPGYHLIQLALDHDIPVSAAPGVSACVTALTLSGLPAHRFRFEGFLPVKGAGRRKRLEELKGIDETLIFYESPHRLLKALRDILDVLDDPWTVTARELTKKFEDVRRGPVSALIRHFETIKPRGEFVVLLNQGRNRNKETETAKEVV